MTAGTKRSAPKWDPVLPRPEALRRAHRQRRRGRPRLTGWEQEERVYHLFWLLLPAALDGMLASRKTTQEQFELEFQELLAGWGVAALARHPEGLTELFEEGSPWEVALTSLHWVLRLKRRTLVDYRWRSARRHRAGICCLFGRACPARGKHADPPEQAKNPRWRAMRRMWSRCRRLNFADLPPDR